jgi:Holliday junction resolvase
MGGTMSRSKGKRGELEVVALAKEHGFGGARRRAPMQCGFGDENDPDVENVGRLWVEAKLYRRVPVNKFAREVLDGKERAGFVNVLAWRDDRTPWRATLLLDDLLKLEAENLRLTTEVVRLRTTVAQIHPDHREPPRRVNEMEP